MKKWEDTWNTILFTAIISGLLTCGAVLYFLKPSDPFPVGRYQFANADGLESGSFWLLDTRTGKIKIWTKTARRSFSETYEWVDLPDKLDVKYGRAITLKDVAAAMRLSAADRYMITSKFEVSGQKNEAATMWRVESALDYLNNYPVKDWPAHARDAVSAANALN